MNRIKTFKVGDEIKGQFRLTSQSKQISENGKVYQKLAFEDASGHIFGYLWKPELFYETLHSVSANEPVSVMGTVKEAGSNLILNVSSLRRIEYGAIVDATQLIPRHSVPLPDLLDKLIRTVDGIKDNRLRNFCHHVFGNLVVALPFLRVQGSHENHHAFPGGLVSHSIDVGVMASSAFDLNFLERDVALVGGLFHDLGKISTNESQRPKALFLDHDLLLLEYLSQPLTILSTQDKHLADELRHIWTFRRSLPMRKPNTPSAVAILAADRTSARENNVQVA